MAVLMMSVMLIAGCSSGEEAAPAADKKSGTTTIGFSIYFKQPVLCFR